MIQSGDSSAVDASTTFLTHDTHKRSCFDAVGCGLFSAISNVARTIFSKEKETSAGEENEKETKSITKMTNQASFCREENEEENEEEMNLITKITNPVSIVREKIDSTYLGQFFNRNASLFAHVGMLISNILWLSHFFITGSGLVKLVAKLAYIFLTFGNLPTLIYWRHTLTTMIGTNVRLANERKNRFVLFLAIVKSVIIVLDMAMVLGHTTQGCLVLSGKDELIYAFWIIFRPFPWCMFVVNAIQDLIFIGVCIHTTKHLNHLSKELSENREQRRTIAICITDRITEYKDCELDKEAKFTPQITFSLDKDTLGEFCRSLKKIPLSKDNDSAIFDIFKIAINNSAFQALASFGFLLIMGVVKIFGALATSFDPRGVWWAIFFTLASLLSTVILAIYLIVQACHRQSIKRIKKDVLKLEKKLPNLVLIRLSEVNCMIEEVLRKNMADRTLEDVGHQNRTAWSVK